MKKLLVAIVIQKRNKRVLTPLWGLFVIVYVLSSLENSTD
jgi:hypothetical protein